MMRRPAAFLALCASLVLSTQALAAELPQRWVSAGGALSEWITALGGEARLVGVDTTSQHPASLKALPSVGYQRQLSAEGILSLRPDVLVGTEEMGPPPVLAQIRKAGVRVELFSSKAELPAVDETSGTWGSCSVQSSKRPRLLRTTASGSMRCMPTSSWPRLGSRLPGCCCWSAMPGPSR